ncbi:MAG: AmmeMemoRadiSam system protein A [Anaerolineales bacterium]|nr:AmmeMemoRadiSam system protein A [Anaerolineales bacterium]MCS7247197.1 AmmeMemoRadiSam system protein A [Anaerolineales bacterium]MDW8161008.1 AmmeMemoRadiSam system protein A [Anaerolineales bacterium]MDW8447141.1 AmmeMemoRadiSam system protein A [Anaerolineales bacterium]
MEIQALSDEEKKYLLKVARRTLEQHFGIKSKEELPPPSERLLQPAATFVTLTINGELRGCVGTLEAYQPLIEDVKEHALAAAFRDFRFPPLSKEELSEIEIEISVLTKPEKLIYESPGELPKRIRAYQDGVVLYWMGRRATFLPQVWDKIPDPEDFLDHLCMKMGVDPGLWRKEKMEASVYQVIEFREGEFLKSE